MGQSNSSEISDIGIMTNEMISVLQNRKVILSVKQPYEIEGIELYNSGYWIGDQKYINKHCGYICIKEPETNMCFYMHIKDSDKNWKNFNLTVCDVNYGEITTSSNINIDDSYEYEGICSSVELKGHTTITPGKIWGHYKNYDYSMQIVIDNIILNIRNQRPVYRIIDDDALQIISSCYDVVYLNEPF